MQGFVEDERKELSTSAIPQLWAYLEDRDALFHPPYMNFEKHNEVLQNDPAPFDGKSKGRVETWHNLRKYRSALQAGYIGSTDTFNKWFEYARSHGRDADDLAEAMLDNIDVLLNDEWCEQVEAYVDEIHRTESPLTYAYELEKTSEEKEAAKLRLIHRKAYERLTDWLTFEYYDNAFNFLITLESFGKIDNNLKTSPGRYGKVLDLGILFEHLENILFEKTKNNWQQHLSVGQASG